MIKVKDGKREYVFYATSHHYDGSLIDFDNPEHKQRFNDAYVKGIEANGYVCQRGEVEAKIAQ